MNQQQALQDVLQKIRQRFGARAIQSARHIQLAPTMLPSSYVALDDICQFPCGHPSLITGRPTAGMNTLAFKLMAATQKQGKHVVYLDSGNRFHSAYALACGVNLDKLLLVEVHDSALLLALMREIVSSGVVDLLVVNTLALRQIQLDLRPIMSAIHNSQCAVVMLGKPYLDVQASLRLNVQRKSWLRDGRDIVGCMLSVQVTHNRFGQAEPSVLLLLPFIESSEQ